MLKEPEDWRRPHSSYPAPTYRRLPPSGDVIENLAYILSKYKHGNSEYIKCPCCTNEAQSIYGELELLFKGGGDEIWK